MKIVIFLIFAYIYNEFLFYITMKHYCKKYKAICENCDCWSCPRYVIINKEKDKIFFNNIKVKIKNWFKRWF